MSVDQALSELLPSSASERSAKGNREMATRSAQLSQLFTRKMKAWKDLNAASNISYAVDQPNIRTPRGDTLMSEQLIAYQQGVDGKRVGRSNPTEGFCHAQSGFLWVSTCDPATIMNLGWFSSRALLSCRTASLELNWSFPNPRLPNRMHLTASKWMWQRIACIIAPWRLQGWWPLLLNKADSRQGSLALC